MKRAITLTVLALSAVAFGVSALRPSYNGVRAGRADQDYLASSTCQTCHPQHYESWARTHHRRMTQEAREGSVQGDFEVENRFEYLGVKALMNRQQGSFFMSLTMPDGSSIRHRIERTVGSRRIEQYVTRGANGYVRLPIAYDLVNRRWMSLNGSFFYPDSDNFFKHQSGWDGNCIFCHNVKAQPNLNAETRSYDSEVAELGIACGACHGRAAEHAARASSPLRRTLWRLDSSSERSVTDPLKLSPERSMMICGHCHGQRVPEPFDRIQEILKRGDPYNAGDSLSDYYRPVSRETRVGEYSFANRFWSDGSPRLTAYEYQGILRSRCFINGESNTRINCLTCHSMHSGNPEGQILSENLTDKPCLSCHSEYQTKTALSQHTGHQPDSSGSRCYTCHMPRVVYGVMSVHPTHEITVPDPRKTIAQAVPNACNQCHLDKSVNWALSAAAKLWPSRFGGAKQSADQDFNLPEGVRALFAGDALTRAVAAEALGGGGPVRPDRRWAGPFLVEAFADDYPVVRFFAANALASGQWQRRKPDYLGVASSREQSLSGWRAMFGASSQDAMKIAATLRMKRRDVDIEVGE